MIFLKKWLDPCVLSVFVSFLYTSTTFPPLVNLNSVMPTKKVPRRNYNFFLIHSTASFDLNPSLGIQLEWLETAVEEVVRELFYLGQSSYLTSWGLHSPSYNQRPAIYQRSLFLGPGSLGKDSGQIKTELNRNKTDLTKSVPISSKSKTNAFLKVFAFTESLRVVWILLRLLKVMYFFFGESERSENHQILLENYLIPQLIRAKIVGHHFYVVISVREVHSASCDFWGLRKGNLNLLDCLVTRNSEISGISHPEAIDDLTQDCKRMCPQLRTWYIAIVQSWKMMMATEIFGRLRTIY